MKQSTVWLSLLCLAAAIGLSVSLVACGRTQLPAQESAAPTEEPVLENELPGEEPERTGADASALLVFSTTDRDGAVWDETSLADYKLIMLNFWEPWCPPCISEMPSLEQLYQNYAEQGFLVLGVYATEGMEEDVDKVLEQSGTSYPILHYCEAFDVFQSGYVPTTVFVTGDGQLVGDIQVGAKSYSGWAVLVEGLL